jgi:hypothetical protein
MSTLLTASSWPPASTLKARAGLMPELPVISDMQNTSTAATPSTPKRRHAAGCNTALLNIDRFTLQRLKAR